MRQAWAIRAQLVGSEFSDSDFVRFEQAGAVRLAAEDKNQLRLTYLVFQGMRAMDFATVAAKPRLRRLHRNLGAAKETLDLLLDGSPDSQVTLTVLLQNLGDRKDESPDLSSMRENISVIENACAKLLSTMPKRGKGRPSHDSATLFIVSVEAIYDSAGGGGKRKFKFMKVVCDAAGCSIAGTDETMKRVGDKARRAAAGARNLHRRFSRKEKSGNKGR